MFCFLLFGRVACFFLLLFGRGTGVHSITGLPGSSLSDPARKATKQQKTGSELSLGTAILGTAPAL